MSHMHGVHHALLDISIFINLAAYMSRITKIKEHFKRESVQPQG